VLRKGNPEPIKFIQCLLDSAYIQLAFELNTFFLIGKLIFSFQVFGERTFLYCR